ncbi:MAG: hypothetical protein ACTSU2_09940 [Promethearchaeota archaeon]
MKYKEFYNTEEKKFDLENYKKRGLSFGDVLANIILVIMFIIFFAYGVFNLYYFGGYIRDVLSSHPNVTSTIGTLIKDYGWQSITVLVAIYFITLGVSYLIVKFFGDLAAFFMYGSAILQIILFLLIWYYLSDFQYRWVFLIPVLLQVLVLTVWYRRFQLAIQYMKMSCLVVWKERKLLLPQFTQTIWIILLGFFHVVTTITIFWDLDNGISDEVQIRDVTISQGWIYGGYTALFVFLVYIVLYVTLGMKILMVHEWYRGGKLSFWSAWNVIQKRWRGIIVYAFSSTIIHLMQFFLKLMRKSVDPKAILDAVENTKELTPTNPMAFDKGGIDIKKMKMKIPLRERIWMGLNYFTLPAIIIEDKAFITALLKSIKVSLHNIPDLYIKHANVNKLFRLMQWVSLGLNMVLGAALSWLFGYIFGLNKTVVVLIAVPLFLWIGGSTSVLVLNDLNLSYITLMYIHTIDAMNDMKGYTRFELEEREKIEVKIIKKEEKKRQKLIKKGKLNPDGTPLTPSSESEKVTNQNPNKNA